MAIGVTPNPFSPPRYERWSGNITTRVYGVEPHSYIDLFHGLQCNVHGSHDYLSIFLLFNVWN